jgi:hypothetical protein
MASVTPSGSAGGIVEITNSAIAPANQFFIVSILIPPGTRPTYTFPDGCTNITFRVRQLGKEVRFFSDALSTGYYTTARYDSGAVNTKNVVFAWESDEQCDVELAYWGPQGNFTNTGVSKPFAETITVTLLHLQYKKIALTNPPNLNYNVTITPRNGITQFLNQDFQIVGGNELAWDGFELDGLLFVGDIIQVDYYY